MSQKIYIHIDPDHENSFVFTHMKNVPANVFVKALKAGTLEKQGFKVATEFIIHYKNEETEVYNDFDNLIDNEF